MNFRQNNSYFSEEQFCLIQTCRSDFKVRSHIAEASIVKVNIQQH